MTMRPQAAIKIKNSSCKQSMAGKVTYAGTIYNISNYSTYGARLKVQYKFKLQKKDKHYLSWDSSEKGFKLGPNKSYRFSISSDRLLPNDSSVKCESNLIVKFLSAK